VKPYLYYWRYCELYRKGGELLTQREQRKAAKEFAKKWEGIGYEKGDSARFWLSLLNEVYGIEKPADYIRFEDQVMLDHTSYIDGFIPSTHVLIEQKSIEKDLRKGIRQSDGLILSPFQQAKRYSIELPYDDRPRWIVLCNFKEFHIFDMNKPQSEPEVVFLKDLEDDYYRLNFLVDKEDSYIKKSIQVSIQAGELVGVLYDALLKQYQDPDDEESLKDLNILCVRLVFCLYAEDAGLFGRHNMFHDYMQKFSDNTASFRDALIKLFKILDQEEHERDPYQSDELLAFPYVNGGLFEKENVVIPRIDEEIIDIILNKASADFNWSNISPTIFGGVFESTLNPETRRSGGMHYTSIENIHKVIDPLFMDELREEFKECMSLKTVNVRKRRLKELQEKMGSLKFLDPAAGSGNFLTETYISLRKLENQILEELHGKQIMLGAVHNPIQVSISQFYGIEINDFAVSVARTALWIAESQMMKETEDIVNINLDFLPLKTYPNIVEGNALIMEWRDVIPNKELDYIMGNPPFLGARMMDANQKKDMHHVFGNLKGVGDLDYVSAWYKKACAHMNSTAIECAFVSTNSITQGEQVAILWEPLFKDYGIHFNFAHETFIWDSEASMKAHVHCVIIGFSQVNRKEKHIYSAGNIGKKVNIINAYLVEGPNIFISSRRNPFYKVPKIVFGSMANDGGNLILSIDEKHELLKAYPGADKFIRQFFGSREFINKIERYCLWISPDQAKDAVKISMIRERVEQVRTHRLASAREETQELANMPYSFGEIRQPETDYLLIPRTSSENRKYIPIAYVDSDTIASDAVLIIPQASEYHFAVMSSNVHNAWMRVVAGRLKSDYRYSASIVYNNFPWPELNDENRMKLNNTANMILKARDLYPEWSYADLYNELTMPPELRKAHQENDKAVMKAYGFNWRNMNESECVAELMKIYQTLIK
jgi:type I restriction-modification system DNA methylase subunit